MARRHSLTPALHQAIVTAIAGGVPYGQACLMADVPPSTANEWRERGEGRHPERPCTPALAAFAAAIKKAEAQDEARRLLRINQAGQGARSCRRPPSLTLMAAWCGTSSARCPS